MTGIEQTELDQARATVDAARAAYDVAVDALVAARAALDAAQACLRELDPEGTKASDPTNTQQWLASIIERDRKKRTKK